MAGNNLLAAKILRDSNTTKGGTNALAEQFPELYGAFKGLLGTAPDEVGGSVLDGSHQAQKAGAGYGFPIGLLAQMLPLAKVTKGMPVGMSIKAVEGDTAGLLGKSKDVVFPSVSDSLEKWAIKQKFNDLSKFTKIRESDKFDLYHRPAATTSRAGYDPTFEGHGTVLAVDKNGQIVGDTFYGPWNGDRASNAIEGAVEVHPGFRRQGVASSMYDQIEAMTGLKMKPAPTHTPLAEAFWQSRNGQPVNQLQKFVYPQEQALLTAQRNAALPVEQGGLGLHPNNTPMERAQAMGFDADGFHGTNSEFPAFDMSKVGSSTVLPYDAPKGAYFAKDPAITSRYAKGEGANVIPAMLNKDGVLLDNSKIIVTDQPQNIRSRFAAFDPFRRNEPDLLAGALPFSALADEENRNQLRGLLGY